MNFTKYTYMMIPPCLKLVLKVRSALLPLRNHQILTEFWWLRLKQQMFHLRSHRKFENIPTKNLQGNVDVLKII